MLAQRTFRLPVNKGLPRGFSNEGFAREVTTPAHATAIGLALYSIDHEQEFAKSSHVQSSIIVPQAPAAAQQTASTPAQQIHVEKRGLMHRVKDWFENF
jgi:cell division ATPase FtsA